MHPWRGGAILKVMTERAKPLLGLVALGALVGAVALLIKFTKPRVMVRPRTLLELKRAIMGSTRDMVASIFGPPPAATSRGPGAPVRDYWHATTWYYPLDRQKRTAVAISFRGDRAELVEFIAGPSAGQG